MFLKRMLLVCVLVFVAAPAFATAVQIDFLMAGMRDPSSDEPLNGGLVYTYYTGTTASASTWTNAGKTVLQTNPIVLDTYGRALAFGDGIYKFIVKNSAGTTLYTWDGVEYKSTATLASDTTSPHGSSMSFNAVSIGSLTATLTADLDAQGYYHGINFATGTADGDTVNVGQMNATLTAAVATLTASISSISASVASMLHGQQIFTSNGTWTCPAGVTTVYVTGSAGGGCGGRGYYAYDAAWGWKLGGGGGGGAGDATRSSSITVASGVVYSCLVGTGSISTSVVGSSTQFASGATILLTLTGGGGGSDGASGYGGGGGAPGGAGGTCGYAGGYSVVATTTVFSAQELGGLGGGNIAGGVGGHGDRDVYKTGIFGGGGCGGGADITPHADVGGAGGPGFLLLEW